MKSGSNVKTRTALKAAAAIVALAAMNGCASVKTMTDDFNRKWDDPQSIIAGMDESADKTRASASSAKDMSAMNSPGCAREAGLPDDKSEAAVIAAKEIAAGECLLADGDDREAAKYFQMAIDHQGGAIASQGRGIALTRMGDYQNAQSLLAAATTGDPGLWRAWNAYGVALDALGRTEESVAAFSRAADLNPANGAALNNLGVALLKSNRREEAIEALKLSLAANGAREAAQANIRLAYALGGDYSGSLRALPDDQRAVALNNAGVAAVTRGDKVEARRLFGEALEVSPHFYAKAYNNLSMLIE